jgi:hypothetical protein
MPFNFQGISLSRPMILTSRVISENIIGVFCSRISLTKEGITLHQRKCGSGFDVRMCLRHLTTVGCIKPILGEKLNHV